MLPHRVLIDEHTIQKRVAELADAIAGDLGRKPPILLGLLTGSFVFLADLARAPAARGVEPRVDFLCATRYGPATDGRLLNEREPYEIDLARVMSAARERGCFLEVNAQPVRRDLSDVHCKMAKDMGGKVAVSTDAHRPSDWALIRFGLDQARRGWLGPEDVLNTRTWTDLKKLLRKT